MTLITGNYANILKNCKILYMPSCLIIEMMTKLYSQVSMINISGNIHAVVPDLLILLRRLNANLRRTSEAYEQTRIKFFIGDWRDDKLRARKLFFNLMSRLGYLCELVGRVERDLLFMAIEDMGREWGNLDHIMEDKCREREFRGKRGPTCRYFRSSSVDSWQQSMANILLSLDTIAEYDDPDTYLILLCYKRIKTQLLREIAAIESKTGTVGKFSPDKILCVSEEDLPITCPSCMLMTECRRNSETACRQAGTQRVARRISLKKVAESPMNEIRNRYLMPASLADINGGKR